MKLSRESWIIAAIGLADLLTTILFIRHHGASEANPLFHLYWEMGLLAFIAAKATCTLGPLLVLEWARKRNPRFVHRGLRGAIAGYVVLYGIGFGRLNAPRAHAEDLSATDSAACARMYADTTRRNEERALLNAQGLPPVLRPIPAPIIGTALLASSAPPSISSASSDSALSGKMLMPNQYRRAASCRSRTRQ